MNLPNYLRPGADVDTRTRQYIILGWVLFVAVSWWYSPIVFLPSPPEIGKSVHDLWIFQNLSVELVTSVLLNIESIAIATVVSLGLAYLGTIAFFEPLVSFIGKLRFLSFAGFGFAFTMMVHDGHARKVSVLVFMVVIYFVVSMVDVINQIPKEQYDLAHTLKMGDWETLYEVVIYGQLDQAFIILRQTAGMAWMMLAAAEIMTMSSGGIGVLLSTASKFFQLSNVMAMQIIVLIVGIVQDIVISWLRTTCCPWVKTARRK